MLFLMLTSWLEQRGVTLINCPSLESLQYLRSTQGIRDRCRKLWTRIQRDESSYFLFDPSRLDVCVAYVSQVIEEQYPNFDIPYHSRMRHFSAGGQERVGFDSYPIGDEQARTLMELNIISVLVDAGAGPDWSYFEKSSGQSFSRSEGLALASLDLFENVVKKKSSLKDITLDEMRGSFQESPENPLIGLEERLHLLHALGDVVAHEQIFQHEGVARLGHIYDFFKNLCYSRNDKGNSTIDAVDILKALLDAFSPIWPSRLIAALGNESYPLGDAWTHPALGDESSEGSVVPFHKLSQWMTYSLLEPLEFAGINVAGIDQLTGLPEYRNGGLFIDTGVLQFKNQVDLQKRHKAGDPLIIEWRAATVCLLDQLLDLVNRFFEKKKGESFRPLTLPQLLQGGTWDAGRRIAREKREGGLPPLNIESDGTVF